jgi:hypothetical protein
MTLDPSSFNPPELAFIPSRALTEPTVLPPRPPDLNDFVSVTLDPKAIASFFEAFPCTWGRDRTRLEQCSQRVAQLMTELASRLIRITHRHMVRSAERVERPQVPTSCPEISSMVVRTERHSMAIPAEIQPYRFQSQPQAASRPGIKLRHFWKLQKVEETGPAIARVDSYIFQTSAFAAAQTPQTPVPFRQVTGAEVKYAMKVVTSP